MGGWRGSPHDLDMAMTQRVSGCTIYQHTWATYMCKILTICPWCEDVDGIQLAAVRSSVCGFRKVGSVTTASL